MQFSFCRSIRKGSLRVWWATCLAILLVWLNPLPAEAATVSPKLEEQVLQILRDHPEVILESVQAYQQRQQAAIQQARQTFLAQMQSDPNSLVGQSPHTDLLTAAGDPKILLIEFADFQCNFCAKAHPAVKQFIDQHSDQVALVYKNFPITSIHPEAMAAAKAAWAAHQQGKFWPYYDALYRQQDQLGEALYTNTAKQLGLNRAQFDRDRNSSAASESIAADVDLAQMLQIEGTPFFALQDKTFAGVVQMADLEQALSSVQASRS